MSEQKIRLGKRLQVLPALLLGIAYLSGIYWERWHAWMSPWVLLPLGGLLLSFVLAGVIAVFLEEHP